MGGECPSRGESKCKGPEAGTCLLVEEQLHSKETNMARAERVGRKRGQRGQGCNEDQIGDLCAVEQTLALIRGREPGENSEQESRMR